MDPVSSNDYSHSQELAWAIKQRFPCTSYLVLLLFHACGHEFSEAVFKRSKSSHFVGYFIMKCQVMSSVIYRYAFRFSCQEDLLQLRKIEDERAVACWLKM